MNSKKFDSFPTITTSRLYLRNFKESDAKQIFILRSSEIVNKFISSENKLKIFKKSTYVMFMNELNIRKYKFLKKLIEYN